MAELANSGVARGVDRGMDALELGRLGGRGEYPIINRQQETPNVSPPFSSDKNRLPDEWYYKSCSSQVIVLADKRRGG
jgi:hypothetical protein